MSRIGACLSLPLLVLPLAAQEPPQVLPPLENSPENTEPPVDVIKPVPLPGISVLKAEEVSAVEMPKNLNIENGGGRIEFVRNELLRLGGPVKITGDDKLAAFSDRAFVDLKAKTVRLEGNVMIFQGNLMQRGERAIYHYDTKTLSAYGLRVSEDPFLLNTRKFTVKNRDGRQIFVGTDVGVTTHDVADPNYWIRAKQVRVYPKDKIVFRDLRVYAKPFDKEIPVFWLPYLSQSLDKDLGYHFLPGTKSNWGPFLLNNYGIMLGGEIDPETGERENAWLLSRWHLDLLARRGAGTGVDFIDKRIENDKEISGLSFYYLNDLQPSITRSGIDRGFVNEDRWKAQLRYRQELKFLPDPAKNADWRMDWNLTALSDAHYLEDFEPRVYRSDPQPDNTVGIYRRDEDSLLSFLTRLQVNDFYRADTRLPEISFNQSRRPIFNLPLLHEGNTSLGVLGERSSDMSAELALKPLSSLTPEDPETADLLNELSGYARTLAEEMISLPLGDPRREEIRRQLIDNDFLRFHTYQEFSLPVTLGGFLNITPQAGAGYSGYRAADGPIENLDKSLLYCGVESSVKFTKNFGDIKDSRLGLDGLMHVLQPYAEWSWVSTEDFETGDPAVDRLTPTTRPRPLDPIRFTAIDELNSWNVVRFGMRNRLLTKRDGQSHEWLFLDTYMDTFIEDPEGSREFSNLYNDLAWNPVPWMGLNVETQFPISNAGSGFSEFNTRLHFMPTDFFDFSVGYRWLNGHPVIQDSNRIELQTYTRLSANWGVATRLVMEMDDGTLENQQYSIHRDFGNWVTGVGVYLNDNRRKNEYGVSFSLTLKDFSEVSLPLEF